MARTAGGTSPKYRPTDHARNYAEIAYRFASEASKKKNRRDFGELTRLAAKRYLADLRTPAKRCGWKFDPWYANDACDFIEKLPHVKGEWDSPTIQLEPSQIWELCALFGFRDANVPTRRRFRIAYLEKARKGAKSTLAAGISLYCLVAENEKGPEILIGATTFQQALKVFKPLKAMVERTADLKEAFELDPLAKSVACAMNDGHIEPVHSKSDNQDGWNPHCVILDELHAHKTRGLYDVFRSAFGSRKNWLLLTITTAGFDVNGVCYEQRKLAEGVLRGAVDMPHIFASIWTLDEKDDPFNPRNWPKANPTIGVTPSWEYVEEFAKEAKESPSNAFNFITKQCNVWTTAVGAWLNKDTWGACRRERFSDEELAGLPSTLGMDLSQILDLTAVVQCFRREIKGEKPHYYLRGNYYLPEGALLGRESLRIVNLRAWTDAGYITLTPGDSIDFDYIEADMVRIMDKHTPGCIGFDPWKAQQIVEHLRKAGGNMVEMRQGPKTFDPPMTELEAAIVDRRVFYEDPVMFWAGCNVVPRFDPNLNKAPDKQRSHDKIDPMVAGLMALNGFVSGVVKEAPTAEAMMP